MNKLSTLALGAVLAAAVPTMASAADTYARGGSEKDAPTATAASRTVNWTGLWLGAVGGLQFNDDKLNQDYTHSFDGEVVYRESAEIKGLGSHGLFGEVQLGYDRQIGNIVVGVFGGLGIDNSEFEASASSSGWGGTDSVEIAYDQEWGGVIGPRLGFASGNSLFYVAGGWAFGEMGKIHASSSDAAAAKEFNDAFANQETDLSGLFGEVGMERQFESVRGLSLKVAGRYTDYGTINLLSQHEADELCASDTSIELKRRNLRAMIGLTYRPQILERLD